MRDPKTIKRILKKIERAWTRYPNLRLSQLLLNATNKNDIYYVEDDDLVAAISKYEKENICLQKQDQK